MPVYEYACKACGQHLEVAQSFKDEPLTTCPSCGGQLRKVFGSIGISFKGSGFYRTDSRPAMKSKDKADGDKADSREKTDAKEKAGTGDKSAKGEKGDKGDKGDKGASGSGEKSSGGRDKPSASASGKDRKPDAKTA